MAKSDFTDFGKINIPKNKKTSLVNNLFGEVSDKYDLMNDLMSLGIHRLWKEQFLDWMAPRETHHLLDLAGGTGDISIGQKKLTNKKFNQRLNWVNCNGEKLPFNDEEFDLVSISFGLRNVTEKDIALGEIYRVLKKGGRFMCLEFSKVNISSLNVLYKFWSNNVIPFLGEKVSGNRKNYEYLIESIKRFPDQSQLSSVIRSAEFKLVKHRKLSGGIAAIHSGWKI